MAKLWDRYHSRSGQFDKVRQVPIPPLSDRDCERLATLGQQLAAAVPSTRALTILLVIGPDVIFGLTAAVLFGALLHASWNALIKGGRDKALDTALIHGLGIVVALPVLMVVGILHIASLPLQAAPLPGRGHDLADLLDAGGHRREPLHLGLELAGKVCWTLVAGQAVHQA